MTAGGGPRSSARRRRPGGHLARPVWTDLEEEQMSQDTGQAMTLLHLYADDNGDTHFGTTKFMLTPQDFAPPAAPFHASDGQPATRFVMIQLPPGWVGEAHVSPKQQVLFCLSGSVKVTCSTGEAKVLSAGMGMAMSDVAGKGHKSEVTSAEPVNAVIIQ